jgi:hypothetical protein
MHQICCTGLSCYADQVLSGVCVCWQAGVYGYGGERSSNWWVSMASLVIGRETSEREERNLEVLNR